MVALWVLKGGSNQGAKRVKQEATRLKTVEKRDRKPLLCFFLLEGSSDIEFTNSVARGEAQLPQACDTVDVSSCCFSSLTLSFNMGENPGWVSTCASP